MELDSLKINKFQFFNMVVSPYYIALESDEVDLHLEGGPSSGVVGLNVVQ